MDSYVIRFASTVAFVLYGVLLVCEYLRPGFVSTTMNVHSVLAVSIVFGLLDRGYAPRATSWFLWMILFGFAMISGTLVWKLGEDFGAFRAWIALVTMATSPFLAVLCYRKSS